MTTYISILRGINVGGHKRIKMEALRQLFVDLGYENVQTYIQSGNVIFQTEDTDTLLLEKSIAEKILMTLGFEVRVFVLDIQTLKTIIQNNPFATDPSKDAAFLHLTFLSVTPEKATVDNVSIDNNNEEKFAWIDKTVYLYCPAGYGNSKFTNTFWESKLRVMATTRNWKTVNELVKLAEKCEK